MKQALVTLNFVVIAVLVTIVAMQSRVDARPKPVAVGGPIPGLLESEIPVERRFSFYHPVSAMLVQPTLGLWTNPTAPTQVLVSEFALPQSVGLVIRRVQPFRTSETAIPARFAVYINGVIAFYGPHFYLSGGPALDFSTEPLLVPPGATLRIEIDGGIHGVNLQGSYVAATELTLP